MTSRLLPITTKLEWKALGIGQNRGCINGCLDHDIYKYFLVPTLCYKSWGMSSMAHKLHPVQRTDQQSK
jgi:hypothetical protein